MQTIELKITKSKFQDGFAVPDEEDGPGHPDDF